ncbi:MAG: hypothetical protein NT052_00765 [Candidatus Shapirobacteria bacterium]|nr:hypothetical protein [Candidatus Shapirobacteria bacterium]
MNNDIIFNEAIIFQNQENSLVTKPEEDVEVKQEQKPLSEAIKNLLETYHKEKEKEFLSANEPRVKVGETLGSIAWVYEKIRSTVDYKGEHLLRRNAIERIIKRLLWDKSKFDSEKVANHLIRELIWARYLKNDTVYKSEIKKIAKILDKYYYLGFGTQWQSWLLGIASCEIEEELIPNLFHIDAYTQAMYNWFMENFNWQDQNLSPQDKNIQILIAIHRALPKSDDSRIRYHLLRIFYQGWDNPNESLLTEIKGNLYKIHREIEDKINHSVQLRLYRYIQKSTAPFLILEDLVDEDYKQAKEILENPKKLEWKIREICDKRYAQIRERVNRGITRSIIYIFLTKVLLAAIIEIPYEMYFIKRFNYLPISINALIPPILMFLVGLSIKRPNETNTERIIERIKGFVYPKQNEEKSSFSMIQSQQRTALNKAFSFFYGIFFIVLMGALAYGLMKLNFNVVSALIFFIFLSMVLLLGYRVRFTASELMVVSEKEGFFAQMFSNLTLPFLRLGFWISRGLSKLNFLTIILDFIIEAPLKIIIEVVDEWTSFIREKKEELVEVPPT